MEKALLQRQRKGNLRKLSALEDAEEVVPNSNEVLDFSSNDYLGLAHDRNQEEMVARRYESIKETLPVTLGSTGSRLLSGDSPYFHRVENLLARVHDQEAALLFNSGYDANLSIVSSLLCDCIVYDEYIHNSLHMGLRLWETRTSGESRRASYSFRHNDTDSLRECLRACESQSVVVLVESVYSMDGDISPLKEMLDIAAEFKARLVVDEAHGLGVYGNGAGVLQRDGLESHPALLCSVHTFGKAAGCHGAVICGSETLKKYLVNFAYPLIYSTSVPLHSLVAIECAYDTMVGSRGQVKRRRLFSLVEKFREEINMLLNELGNGSDVRLLNSTSPIQALVIPGNDRCVRFSEKLYLISGKTIRLFPIKTPTVPKGQERVRIIIHTHNDYKQIETLISFIRMALHETEGLRSRL